MDLIQLWGPEESVEKVLTLSRLAYKGNKVSSRKVKEGLVRNKKEFNYFHRPPIIYFIIEQPQRLTLFVADLHMSPDHNAEKVNRLWEKTSGHGDLHGVQQDLASS